MFNKEKLIDKNKIHYRHLMLFYYRKGKKSTYTTNKICSVYGKDAISKRTVRKWFCRFKQGKFCLEDNERSGRPSTIDDEQLITLLYYNSKYSLDELSLLLDIRQNTIREHLVKNGYVNVLDSWVLKNLNKSTSFERKSICEVLFQRQQMKPFLHRLIVGGKKWILFDNTRKRKIKKKKKLKNVKIKQDGGENSDSNLRSDCKSKKALLSIWWDCKGLIYYELTENEQLTSERYCEQLKIIKCLLEQKRPELMQTNSEPNEQTNKATGGSSIKCIYHHNNARPHIAEQTKQKLAEFDWEILPHPPSSPDMSPNDNYLFRSLQMSLNNETFASLEEIRKHLDTFFATKNSNFWSDGIMNLTSLWKQIIERNGAYLK